ncbi:hypothetical protein P4S68_16975 [Pseudoalteromonas sp. Hal099]
MQFSAAAMAFKRRSDSSTLVSGQEYNARYQYTILKDRPIWSTYFSAQWQDFERTLAPLGIDQRARPLLIDIQPFRRFALGTSLSSNSNLAPLFRRKPLVVIRHQYGLSNVKRHPRHFSIKWCGLVSARG